jgi:dTDP-4-amino-4,6-dideoxygalactose transaminase
MQKIKRVPYLSIERAHKDILPELINSFEKTVKSGNLVLGPNVERFEKEYAKFCQVKFSSGVACGLDALIISLNVLRIREDDEVIVPSNTYIATLLAVSKVGAKPILVEPRIETYNINPAEIEKSITKKTKAIIPVHLFGQACEMDKIMKNAKKNNLFVIEDNAQSHGALFKGKPTGSFGQINATSFYPGKNLGALGEGGAITTNSISFYEESKIIRNYGSKEKYVNQIKGLNSRLDEIQAGILSIKLKGLSVKNKKRQKLAKIYLESLTGVGDLVMPRTVDGSSHVYHVFNIRTKKRNELQKYLTKKGIGTMIHYPIPPHMQKAYKELGFKKGDFPIAEELANTSLSIPIFPEMNENEQEYVIKSIEQFYAK